MGGHIEMGGREATGPTFAVEIKPLDTQAIPDRTILLKLPDDMHKADR